MKKKTGRPTKYRRGMSANLDKYLSTCQDEVYEFHKVRGEKTNTYERRVKVKLPTIYGFANFLGVAEASLYDWAKKDKSLLESLQTIKSIQKEKLVLNSLSGDYNSTIAKLILSSNHGFAERVKSEHSGEDGEPFVLQIKRSKDGSQS